MRIYTNAYDAQAGVWCIDEWKKQTSGLDDQSGKGLQLLHEALEHDLDLE